MSPETIQQLQTESPGEEEAATASAGSGGVNGNELNAGMALSAEEAEGIRASTSDGERCFVLPFGPTQANPV